VSNFWGSIVGGVIAAILGSITTLLVETYRHRRQKAGIIKALQREISYNNSIIEKMIDEKWKSGTSGFGSPFDGLQIASYIKARDSGVVAEFSASKYEEVSTVYQIILDIKKLIDSGIRISGRVSPQDPDNKVFYVKGIDSKGSGHYIVGIEQLPERLSKLEANFR
jgi:Tfp pilus assembly major pilin PilA